MQYEGLSARQRNLIRTRLRSMLTDQEWSKEVGALSRKYGVTKVTVQRIYESGVLR